MSEEKRVEEMKAELVAAGYEPQKFADGGFTSAVYLPNRSVLFYGADTMAEAIPFAYEALQREKRYAAMEALLSEMYHGYVDSEPNYDITPLAPFENWLGRVKALLGEGAEE